jgi:hypothetical protein
MIGSFIEKKDKKKAPLNKKESAQRKRVQKYPNTTYYRPLRFERQLGNLAAGAL